MNWELILIVTSIMLFAYWVNYLMGSPLAKPEDIDERAILFRFPLWLAERRLPPEVMAALKTNFYEEINHTSDFITKVGLNYDFKKNILLKGRELFTWERAILCPVCLHWWLSVLVGVIFLTFDLLNARADFPQAALTYLILHLIIRKIS
jgi:uncharacterized membrane protein YagU involved in acid resistance